MNKTLGEILSLYIDKTISGIVETPEMIRQGKVSIQFSDGSKVLIVAACHEECSPWLDGGIQWLESDRKPVTNIPNDIILNEDCGTERGNPIRDGDLPPLWEDES